MIEKPEKLIPALYGGVVMAVVSTVPFLSLINCLCCAGLMLGGLLAVFFYKNEFTPDTPPYTTGDCMAVGALAGVVGAVVATALNALFVALFGNVMIEFLFGLIESLNLDIPEDVMDEVRQKMEEGALETSIVFEFLFNLILYPLFGLVGGVIGYGIWKPKPPELYQNPPLEG